MDIKNYVVTWTFSQGRWTAHVEGPDGDIRLPVDRFSEKGSVTFTTCMEQVRTAILDHHAKR